MSDSTSHPQTDQEPLLEVTEALIEAGGQALLECLGCGTCTGVCPWGLVREYPVRRMIRQAALGLEGFEPLSWLCLTCRACVERCPQQIDLTAVMQSMRAVAAEMGGLPPGVSAAVGSLSAAGNPWGGEPSERAAWMDKLDHPEVEGPADMIYFNCCTSAYDGRAQKLALAAVTLLHRAGRNVAFTAEGNEVCCGDLALRAGRTDLAEQLAKKNAAAFEAADGADVVTLSPHCRQAFNVWYGDLGVDVPETRHVIEVLVEALDEGKLELTDPFEGRVSYHDPCYLGRHAGIYEPPRTLLRAVPGLELVELRRNRENALCCGGGGGGAFRETSQQERHALLRVDEAIEAGAEVIATACPLCLLMFEDAIRVRNLEDTLRVLDICEIVLGEADGSKEGGS